MPVLTNRMWQKKLYCWGWGPRALRLSHFPCLGYTTLEVRIPVRSVTTLRLAHPKEAQAAMWPPGGCEVPDICLDPSGTSSPGGPLTPCLWAANPSQGCLGQSYSAHPCWILDTYNCEQFRVAIFKPLCFGIAGYTVIDNKNNWLTPPTVFPQGKFTRKPNHLMNERIRAEKMVFKDIQASFSQAFFHWVTCHLPLPVWEAIALGLSPHQHHFPLLSDAQSALLLTLVSHLLTAGLCQAAGLQ